MAILKFKNLELKLNLIPFLFTKISFYTLYPCREVIWHTVEKVFNILNFAENPLQEQTKYDSQ